jgi:SAM-dependent methyltransferase
MAAAHKSQFQEPHAARMAWWSSPLGSALIAAESQLLGEALEDVFGWELLQIGAWGGGRELLSSARTRHQAIVALPGLSSSADIRARPTQLPILSDSIDAVLLPHILEFATDPYAIVREADRVLVGEGRLLVLGFRPWSLWGLRGRWSRSGFPPGMRRVLSERRIRGPWSRGLAAGEDTGRLLRRGLTHPLPANAYLLKARKRIYTLTPIRPRFRERPAVLGGLVKPSPPSRA